MKIRTLPVKMLEEYTKEWQALINNFPYPISVHDTDFNIVMANKAVYDICGKSDDIKGMKCYQLFHCTDRPVEDCPMVKTLKSEDIERADFYEPSLKKSLVVMTAPIRVEENLIGVIHSATDITELKKSEEDCKELVDIYAESINQLKKREQSFLKGRDAFFNMLEDISESHKELEDLFIKFVAAMVNALDAKSHWTKGHSEMVANYAVKIAKELNLDEDDIKTLQLAGLLHDIGKIGTYDYLLEKPTSLTDKEFGIVKNHPEQGVTILKDIKKLKKIIPLIMHHHERIDGKGYPRGLKGKEIPLGARILHVADSYDSMTSNRPYRPAPGKEYAISELKKYKGTQFDPQVVEAFLKVLDKS